MDTRQALRIFEQFGGHLHGGGPAELRSTWISLARRYHVRAAHGGTNERAMAEINAAYDVLKRAETAVDASALTRDDPRIRGVCAWAWAGHPGGAAPPPTDRIVSMDARDPNFVKRRLWQLSEGSKEQWTIWCFDGQRFMAPLHVYAAQRLFDEMADMALHCARVGFRRPRAVFVQKHLTAWPKLLLIHLDGQRIPALPFTYDSAAAPSRDLAFVGRLPLLLDDVRKSAK